MRPSRRPLRGLLRMTESCNATHKTSSSWRSARRARLEGRMAEIQPLLRCFRDFDAEIVDRDAPVDAVFLGRVVTGGAVIGAAIVPDHDVALFPFVMVLGIGRDHPFFQFGDQLVSLRALNADEIDDLARI